MIFQQKFCSVLVEESKCIFFYYNYCICNGFLSDTLDFSKLSLHHTKRMEMETLVKVLETEKQLDVERSKLSELRKHHYRLAGEIEGWEEGVSVESCCKDGSEKSLFI